MKKITILFFLIFGLSYTYATEAEDANQKAFFSYCSNFGDGVSFSFSSCVNRNFREAQRELGGFYSHCSNFGDEVSFSYISCIQSNFRSVERNADGSLYLSYCSNFDRDRLGFSFVSCVNSNFRSIESYLRRQAN